MTEFICSTKIVAGSGAVQALKEMAAHRAMIVSDPFFVKNGAAQKIGQLAAEKWEIFDGVVPDPTVELVAEGAARVKEFQPELVVALGGGSALDCAKAMAYFSGVDLRLVAIPTTSGSGSEMTDFAVLTHDGVKYPLVDGKLRPHLAILDDDFLQNLPAGLIADAGLDALSHGLEALVAKNANSFTDALALGAVEKIFRDLPESYAGVSSVRLSVHMASAMAAVAFNQAGLGVCHAISHALGGKYHVPHGRLNGVLLPAVLAENGVAASQKYENAAAAVGLGGPTAGLSVRNLRNGVIRLRRMLDLPENLAQAGIKPGLLRQDRSKLVETILRDPCCQTNPVPVSEEMVFRILEEVGG